MSAREAVRLDNWFPRIGKVVSRPGYTQHCDTTTGEPIAALLEYEYGSSHKMVASSNGALYEVSTATPTTLASSLSTTSVYWQGVQFGQYLIMCNGTDHAKSYDGSTVSDVAHTGLAGASWDFVHTHGNRLYVAEVDSATFYYSGVDAAASGALSSVDLSLAGLFRGNIEIICSISRDGGAGPDDYIAFVSTSGDVLVYQGTNPGDANAWSKVGEYKIGRPLGRRAYVQADADVYILTNRGYESLAQNMVRGDAIRIEEMPSYKIQNEVLDRIDFAGISDQWSIAMYPLGQMMIVTVPRPGNTTEQHVRNTNTGAWCRFTIPAHSWLQCGTSMYLGDDDGVVHIFDNGAVTDGGTTSSNGTAIACDGQSAWTYLGYRDRLKKLNFVRQTLTFSLRPAIRTEMGVDFNGPTAPTSVTIAADTATGYPWDDTGSVWDVAEWASPARTQQFTYKETGLGYAFSQRMQVDASLAQLEWGATTFVYERGHQI